MQHFYYASGQDEFYLVLINTFTKHQDKMKSEDLVLINPFTKHQDKMKSILS